MLGENYLHVFFVCVFDYMLQKGYVHDIWYTIKQHLKNTKNK